MQQHQQHEQEMSKIACHKLKYKAKITANKYMQAMTMKTQHVLIFDQK